MSLNPQQRAAAEHVRGPLLVLAGAGSGKTRVITHRISHLIRQARVPPEHILAVTFTNKAAREMQERVAQLIGSQTTKKLHLSTFHSLGLQILKKHSSELGYRGGCTILDPGDQIGILREVLKEQGASLGRSELKSVQAIISRAKNEYCRPADLKIMRLNPMRPYAQRAFIPYVEACKAMGGVDFDDLLVLPLKLFHSNKSILEKCRDRYRYIMVDEYQDTNAVQLLLLRQLGAPRNNVCVVGDDDQSIYAFRGAVFRNILEFEKHFKGARVVKLEQNYRSTSRILTAANAVIRNNKHRRAKALWSSLGSGEMVRYVELEGQEEEASFVAGDMLRERLTRKRPWKDFAILYRTATLSRNMEEALRVEQIPYKLVGSTQFFDRREVKDLASYLRVMLNPSDEAGVRRSVNVPPRGLGPTALAKLTQFANDEGVTLYRALWRARDVEGLGPAQRRSIQGYLDLIEEHRKKFQSGKLSEACESLLDGLKYRQWLRSHEKSEKIIKIRLENIDEIVSSLASFQSRGGTLEGYVSRLALRDTPRDKEKEDAGDVVTLMTLHASKGLEFPCVYLVGFEEEILPHVRSMEMGADGDLEEERRLTYVGITRAREKLVMTSAHLRGRGKARRERHPSRFLHEIPDEVIRISRHGEPDVVASGEEGKKTGREFLKLIQAALD